MLITGYYPVFLSGPIVMGFSTVFEEALPNNSEKEMERCNKALGCLLAPNHYPHRS